MSYALNQGLKSIYDSMREQIDAIAQEVKLTVIDKYWEEWKQKNQEISASSYGGGTFNPGKYAPNLVLIGTAKKRTIIWSDWGPTRKGIRKQVFSRPVKKNSSGYTKSSFKKVVDWEWEMIEECEQTLIKYRDALELLHTQRIAIGRQIAKQSKNK
ncbi:UNVERIFIED_ORG: hypothetical protein M2414_005166 [Rahnella aquatilis]